MFRSKPFPSIVLQFCDIDSINYISGETIEGFLSLFIKEEVKVALLRVYLVGREDYIKKSKTSSTSLVNIIPVNIISEKEILEPGEYKYPFQLILPTDLSPSVCCPGSFLSTYALRGEIKLAKFTKIVQTHFDIFIHRPEIPTIPASFNDKYKNGVIHKESLQLRCIPSENAIQLWEPIDLEITIQNNTKKQVCRTLLGLEKNIIKGSNKVTDTAFVYQKDQKITLDVNQTYSETIEFCVEQKPGLQIPASYKGHKATILYKIVFSFEFSNGSMWHSKMPIEVNSAPFNPPNYEKTVVPLQKGNKTIPALDPGPDSEIYESYGDPSYWDEFEAEV